MKLKLPKKVIIYGIEYKIRYFDKIDNVDVDAERMLFGQVIYGSREIRIYKGKRKKPDIITTIIHEILHAITADTKVSLSERNITQLALMLTDTLIRNKFII